MACKSLCHTDNDMFIVSLYVLLYGLYLTEIRRYWPQDRLMYSPSKHTHSNIEKNHISPVILIFYMQ